MLKTQNEPSLSHFIKHLDCMFYTPIRSILNLKKKLHVQQIIQGYFKLSLTNNIHFESESNLKHDLNKHQNFT
ncbi:hypothetical protein Scep_014961 [Stephania cephalantha]|uniref:Uncharacterized protein n=1 Tax=Stephania cephalantha TaxID=152367 RepID=A0AAP0P2B1_9MAGN